ncbi:MAG: hypothetical protein M3333_03205 [Actinomycetota bacterium]|nr:hypothetical protein [Actinomycetota bacterium]
MLTRRSRRLRVVATAVVVVALVAGSAAGQDDHFPFGPFRMYAVTTKPTGQTSSLRLEGVIGDAERRILRIAEVGMRRAELQTQLVFYGEEILPHLASGYRRLHPGKPPVEELRIVYVVHRLEGGATVGDPTSRTALIWRRDE